MLLAFLIFLSPPTFAERFFYEQPRFFTCPNAMDGETHLSVALIYGDGVQSSLQKYSVDQASKRIRDFFLSNKDGASGLRGTFNKTLVEDTEKALMAAYVEELKNIVPNDFIRELEEIEEAISPHRKIWSGIYDQIQQKWTGVLQAVWSNGADKPLPIDYFLKKHGLKSKWMQLLYEEAKKRPITIFQSGKALRLFQRENIAERLLWDSNLFYLNFFKNSGVVAYTNASRARLYDLMYGFKIKERLWPDQNGTWHIEETDQIASTQEDPNQKSEYLLWAPTYDVRVKIETRFSHDKAAWDFLIKNPNLRSLIEFNFGKGIDQDPIYDQYFEYMKNNSPKNTN